MKILLLTLALFVMMQSQAYPQTYPQDTDIVAEIDDCLYGMELCLAGYIIAGGAIWLV